MTPICATPDGGPNLEWGNIVEHSVVQRGGVCTIELRLVARLWSAAARAAVSIVFGALSVIRNESWIKPGRAALESSPRHSDD
jgi:hypothetical protein